MAYNSGMESAQFRDAFYESCNFARLHGWCDQTNERIAALLKIIQAESNARKEHHALVLANLEQVDSVEEKLLTLVILAELGSPPEVIAELMYIHLQGRLTSKDSSFITRHLFRNVSPVPDEITYDITKRNFISYQRAIFEALKIGTFESEFDPQHILLFFIQLLCRNNVNEQNRAMLYLLLSRLDIELPPKIEQVVKTAMVSLADVIREVEQRLEAVLSDTIHGNDLTLENTTWEDLQPKPVKAEKPPPITLVQAQESNLLGDLGSARAGPINASPQAVTPPRVGYAGDYFNNPAPPPQTEPQIPAPPPNTPRPAAKSGPGYDRIRADDTQSQDSLNYNLDTSMAPSKEKDQVAATIPQATVAPPQFDYSAGSANTAGPAENPTFVISFTRETSELKAVLQALKNSPVSEAKLFGDSPRITERLAVRTELVGRLVKAFLFSRWGLVLLGVLVGLAIVFLALRLGAGREKLVEQAVAAVRQEQSARVDTQAQSDSGGPDASARTADTEGSLAQMAGTNSLPGQPPLIKTGAGQSIWYPRSGDSLWVLYSWIRNHPELTADLQPLVKGEWQGFLVQISALNPRLTFPDAIYPDKPIIVR